MAVLAGGSGRRIGGDKACVALAGRPLISYPLAAARAADLDAVVIARADTALPPIEHSSVLIEPADLPRHPLAGIITGLQHHDALVVVGCDMPFLSAEVLRRLAGADGPLTVASAHSPFPGLYAAELLDQLRQALAAEASMRSVLAAAGATVLAGVDPALLFSVNSPQDLQQATLRLAD